MIFLLTIYLQQIQGYSALSAGLAFLPTALVFLSVGGYLSAKLVTRFGPKPVLLVGMTIQTAGFLLLRPALGRDPLPHRTATRHARRLARSRPELHGLQHSSAERREEGRGRPRVRAHQHLDAGRRPHRPRDSRDDSRRGGGQPGRVGHPAVATVEGFRYAFLGAAVLSGDRDRPGLAHQEPQDGRDRPRRPILQVKAPLSPSVAGPGRCRSR